MKTPTLSLFTVLLLAGCASGPPFIDQIQPEAVNMAVRRGQFELNCPTATGQVISRDAAAPRPDVSVFRPGPCRVHGGRRGMRSARDVCRHLPRQRLRQLLCRGRSDGRPLIARECRVSERSTTGSVSPGIRGFSRSARM
jgi:hypothetical protein